MYCLVYESAIWMSQSCGCHVILGGIKLWAFHCACAQYPGRRDFPALTWLATKIMASSSGYCCPLCEGFVVPTYRLWLSHLRHIHSHDPNFHVTCGVNSCPRTFRVFSSLYSHVYRSHRNMLERRESVVATDCEDLLVSESASDGVSLISTEGWSTF